MYKYYYQTIKNFNSKFFIKLKLKNIIIKIVIYHSSNTKMLRILKALKIPHLSIETKFLYFCTKLILNINAKYRLK